MFNLEKIVRSNIWNLSPYSSARDEFKGTADIFLDANENPFGDLNRYPDPYQLAVKEKLSQIQSLATNQIFLGNGSDEVIDLAFRIFCNPAKDKALTFSPTYGMYDVSAEINNVELIKQPLTRDFQIDIEATKPLLKDENLKLIFICSPNNPTGNTIHEKDIEWILQSFNGIVIIDEAYIDFSTTASFIQKINQYPNLVVSQTFSKAWGLAGVRVGVCYANKETISLYNSVKPPYNISSLNQQVVINALDDIATFERRKKLILLERALLQKKLDGIPMVKKIYPSDANFLLIEVDDADSVYKALTQQKIIIRNRTKLVKNCLRITVGSKGENEQLINALKNI